MGDLRTSCVVLLAFAAPLRAEADLVATFATCAGRFSAELEHAWLMRPDRADRIASRRAAFSDLLDAATAPDQRADALNLRIEAKAAHAGLLSHAAFSRDAEMAVWALKRARSELDYCTGFLLES